MNLESIADAIDAARYAHPDHPRERPRPFSEADRSDREYALRLARAALNEALDESEISHIICGLHNCDCPGDENGADPAQSKCRKIALAIRAAAGLQQTGDKSA